MFTYHEREEEEEKRDRWLRLSRGSRIILERRPDILFNAQQDCVRLSCGSLNKLVRPWTCCVLVVLRGGGSFWSWCFKTLGDWEYLIHLIRTFIRFLVEIMFEEAGELGIASITNDSRRWAEKIAKKSHVGDVRGPRRPSFASFLLPAKLLLIVDLVFLPSSSR